MITEERLLELWLKQGRGIAGDYKAFARAVEREAYEAAAKLCDAYFPHGGHGEGPAIHCAAAIRALKKEGA